MLHCLTIVLAVTLDVFCCDVLCSHMIPTPDSVLGVESVCIMI